MARSVSRSQTQSGKSRRGAILVLAAIFIVVIFAFAAFTVDTGYMLIVKTELQSAADGAALAGVTDLGNGVSAVNASVQAVANQNKAAGSNVTIASKDIELGFFNLQNRSFTPTNTSPNAVKVTAQVTNKALFVGPVINRQTFNMSASAIAMVNPRDIVFVVDLSGSMNDDTECVWATNYIQQRLTPLGYGSTAQSMMQSVYDDFGFGPYPGELEYIGEPLGIRTSEFSYAEMTKDDGPLTCSTLDSWYRIANTDSEDTRRTKCYRWIIDKQIQRVLGCCKPKPDSRVNYDYWQRYIDYIIEYCWVGDAPPWDGGGWTGSGGGGYTPPSPPAGRPLSPRQRNAWNPDRSPAKVDLTVDAENGDLLSPQPDVLGATTSVGCGAVTYTAGCPRQGRRDYIQVPVNTRIPNMYSYNNPNFYTFPEAGWDSIWNKTNRIGYVTYVQFMMDYGREKTSALSDSGTACTPLSAAHSDCPWHSENTAGGCFSFPPREQPMHAARRSLIAAIEIVRQQNSGVPAAVGDWVSVVTFDAVDGTHAPKVVQPLTSDFAAAMQSCTGLQSVWDQGTTTATEYGLKLARDHIKPSSDGGSGRLFATKVIVLLSDGVPNVWYSTAGDIANENSLNPSGDYYQADYLWYNAALMQASKFQRLDKGKLYPVGMGIGADLDFMDRVARISKTDKAGLSPRGAGNPAEYEQRLTAIFREIIQSPGSRLVK